MQSSDWVGPGIAVVAGAGHGQTDKTRQDKIDWRKRHGVVWRGVARCGVVCWLAGCLV